MESHSPYCKFKSKTLEGNANDINNFFNSTAAHITVKEPV